MSSEAILASLPININNHTNAHSKPVHDSATNQIALDTNSIYAHLQNASHLNGNLIQLQHGHYHHRTGLDLTVSLTSSPSVSSSITPSSTPEDMTNHCK